MAFTKYKLGRKETLQKPKEIVCGVSGSTEDYQRLAAIVLVVSDDLIQEDASWELFDPSSKDEHGVSTVHCVQASCRDHELMLSSDGLPV